MGRRERVCENEKKRDRKWEGDEKDVLGRREEDGKRRGNGGGGGMRYGVVGNEKCNKN